MGNRRRKRRTAPMIHPTYRPSDWDNEADENVIESVTLSYDFFGLVQ